MRCSLGATGTQTVSAHHYRSYRSLSHRAGNKNMKSATITLSSEEEKQQVLIKGGATVGCTLNVIQNEHWSVTDGKLASFFQDT